MAEEPKPEAQLLSFGNDGNLRVYRSFSSPSGLLHMTDDGGFYFRPGQPLTDDAVASALPEPYHEMAHTFIASQTAPPETPVADALSARKEDDDKPGSIRVGPGRR